VRNYLQRKGYQVTSLNKNGNLDSYDAIVVTGQDSNMLGIENTKTKTPVITAGGQSAEQVYDEIKRRLQ
jgi:hypothetical protein